MADNNILLTPAAANQTLIRPDGRLTREGIIFLNQLLNVAQQSASTETRTTNAETISAIEDSNNQRDFSPDLQDAETLSRETPRIFDDAELRNALAGSDSARGYDDAELRNALAGADTPRPYDDSDLRNALTGTDAPQVSRADLDELRTFAAWNDAPQLTNLGTAAYAALPLSIANGGTGQITAAAALTALGGASLTAANSFSGANTFNSTFTVGGQLNPHIAIASNAAGEAYLTLEASSTVQWQISNNDSSGNDFSVKERTNNTYKIQVQQGTAGKLALNQSGGNVLVGTNTDNGTDKLQVSGTVNASGFKSSGTAGVSGSITIPKLTTANGSITVSNGIITAFTNPT